MKFAPDDTTTKWVALSLQGDDPMAVLDRLEIPNDVRQKISERLTPGSSLIIGDTAINTAGLPKGADFLVWANDTPAPQAVLLDMGDGWMHFEVRVWARGTDTSDALVTELNLAAWRALHPPDPTPAAAQPESAPPKPS